MGIGIQICGLNGCGKSTLGRALADRLGFHFIDSEDLYFRKDPTGSQYASARSQEEAKSLLMQEVFAYPNFIFASVKGNYGEEIAAMYNYVILIDVPSEIREQRIRNRSFQKLGSRMLPGGDLYAQEEAFIQMAAARKEDHIENWLQSVKCPILKIDGSKSIADNVEYVLRTICM